MADETKPATKAAASTPKAKLEAEPPVLGVAAESSDPAVQQLLAHRSIAVLNGDEDAVEAVDKKLADLGVK